MIDDTNVVLDVFLLHRPKDAALDMTRDASKQHRTTLTPWPSRIKGRVDDAAVA